MPLWNYLSLLMVSCVFLRDGVSESQFNQVLNIELDEIMKVFIRQCKFEIWLSEWYHWNHWNCICRHANVLRKIGFQSSLWLLPKRIIILGSLMLMLLTKTFQLVCHFYRKNSTKIIWWFAKHYNPLLVCLQELLLTTIYVIPSTMISTCVLMLGGLWVSLSK